MIPRNPSSRGVTLPELLVALLCACLVAWIAFDLVRDENRNYTRTRAKVRTQEDAREAMRILEEDLKNSGFHRLVKAGITGTTPINPKDSVCPLLPEDRLRAFDDAGLASDTVWISSFLPRQNQFCGDPILIKYYVDNNSVLKRDLVRGTQVFQSNLLQNVRTFQAQIGYDSSSDDQTRSKADTLIRITSQGLGNNDGLGFNAWPIAASDVLNMSSWIDRSVGSLHSTGTFNFQPNSKYVLELTLRADDKMLSWRTNTSLDSNVLVLALDTSGPWYRQVRIALPTQKVDQVVRWSFQTDSVAKAATLHLESLLRNTVGDPAGLLILSKLRLYRVRQSVQGADGTPWTWIDGTSDVARRRQTQALKVWLLSKSQTANVEGEKPSFARIGNRPASDPVPDHNAYVLHERVIPVVNP